MQEGSCASNDDCAPGEYCFTYQSTGILGSYTDRICKRGPGDIGEPCGESFLEACVPGASCLYPSRVEIASEPVIDNVGNTYWFDSEAVFNSTSEIHDLICVANGSLGIGELCSDSLSCAPGLLCHGGYTPTQCQPRSDVGGPCLMSRDCQSRSCVLPDQREDSDPLRSSNCALADPRCDIRLDAACGHWLSCARCGPAGG